MFGGPQALITYANVPPEAIQGGNFTIAHGLTPSMATIQMVPTGVIPNWTGLLTITYDNVRLEFPDCRMLDISERDDASGQRWTLRIQDRRWKWSFGRIRGRYNLREAPASNVVPLREKTPTEMIELLLEALHEYQYDIEVPDDVRPFVDWDDSPTGKLQSLLDQLGCRLWIDPQTNVVMVRRVGLGNDLPFLPEITSNSLTVSPPVPPDNMFFMGGKTIYQDDLRLEAVGIEGVGDPANGIQPGTIRPIDDLSYAKDFQWRYQDPHTLANVDKRNRDAAARSVWKYYRIVEPVDNHFELEIPERRLILPLEDHLLEWHNVDGERVNMQPIVFGRFDQGMVTFEEPEKTVYSKVAPPALGGFINQDYWRYAKAPSFSLDARRGIVMFSEPVTWWDPEGDEPPAVIPEDQGMYPATLWLRCCFGVRDPFTEAWDRAERSYHDSPYIPGTTHYVVREDEFCGYYYDLSTPGTPWTPASPTFGQKIHNETEFNTAAQYYLEQEMLRFTLQFPASRTYAGIIPIPLDGAVQSVTWSIPESGQATTTANRNREDYTRNVPYLERQQFVLMNQIKQQQNERFTSPLDTQTGTRRFGSIDAYY